MALKQKTSLMKVKKNKEKKKKVRDNGDFKKTTENIKELKIKQNDKKNKKLKVKKSISKKLSVEKKKLDDLYKLEIKNYKKSKYTKNDNNEGYDSSSSNSTSYSDELLNNDYDDIKKISKLVQEHVQLYKFLLRTRILTQKLLCLSNKLPLLPFVSFNELLVNKKYDEDLDGNNSNSDNSNGDNSNGDNSNGDNSNGDNSNGDNSNGDNINNEKVSPSNEIQYNEENVKNSMSELLCILHNLLKNYFIKSNITVNEKAYDEINIICDEDDKEYYEKRKQSYFQDTTDNEKKLFSLIDTWFRYSKNMCLNYFDIMHKITKMSSIKSLKTYEQPISTQINQVMFDLPTLIENAHPQKINHNIIGKELYELLYADNENFNLNQFIYNDEVYYKKFLINAIKNLQDNQEDNELIKSQKEFFKIKKKYTKDIVPKGKVTSFEPIPKLINFMLPEPRSNKDDNPYEYVDNPEMIDVLLSSLFQD
ncbi:conserved protein, unknown function [Hepatocystis sp. ex Piliocolobus tephrosceles]|nr:conserved protein, unknown function [Hepatocystis sp. ex Piliocolobus tephrosceles]